MSNNDGVRLGRIIADWWCALHPREDGIGGDRATTARLRRAETLHQVMVVPETMHLYRNLCNALARERLSESEAADVAILAGVLAAVKPGQPKATFATMLGRTAEGKQPGQHERPLFSSQRFAALILADDPEERLRHLRRAAALVRRTSFDVVRFAMVYGKDCRAPGRSRRRQPPTSPTSPPRRAGRPARLAVFRPHRVRAARGGGDMTAPLHLSRLTLKKTPEITPLINVLQPAGRGDAIETDHRLIWAAMPGELQMGHRPDRGGTAFLWRRDDTPGRYFVLGPRPRPESSFFDINTKPFEARLAPGDRLEFVLRVNATVDRRSGGRNGKNESRNA